MPRIEEFDRESVLKNAMNVFWEKGYNGTSMQDLVDATGLNRSSLYNSFGSKLELYQDTLKHYQKETGGMFQKALVKAKNPLEAIRLIFESFLPEIISDEKSKGCYSMNCKAEMGNQDKNIRQWLLNTQEQSLQLFQNLIKSGQEQGIINKRLDCRTYAYYVFNTFQGFRMTGILVKDRTVLKGIIEQTIDLLK
ncbi:TetR/AcrR family transcriptional regulator [Flavobacteriaceae bacterium TP-CH-4]|uniref:TetR/AcrR family transcriptional regulator n=1 Tax=Pelagihabitans pacificus TaxID=2696054 RepID=A0A967AWF9_9FLAO|nr:TetR/AcrR family transcriptional regulator [Pelagihabitans pacificus]NHF60388.1 TetR/AcrR family transcriptional regulator [Pelagihabitans pacificus]